MADAKKAAEILALGETGAGVFISGVATAVETLGDPSLSPSERADIVNGAKKNCAVAKRDFDRVFDLLSYAFGVDFLLPAKKRVVAFAGDLARAAGAKLGLHIKSDFTLKNEGAEMACDVERFSRLFFIAAKAVGTGAESLTLSVSDNESCYLFRLSSDVKLSSKALRICNSRSKDEKHALLSPSDPRFPYVYANMVASVHKGSLLFDVDSVAGGSFAEFTVPKKHGFTSAVLTANAKIRVLTESIAESEFIEK